VRKVDKQDSYTMADERDMTFAGFAAFLDPPKKGTRSVLEDLKKNGVSVVIMTGVRWSCSSGQKNGSP